MTDPDPHLLAYHQEQRERLARHLQRVPRAGAVLSSMEADDTIIGSPRKRDYLLPHHFKKTMPPVRLDRLGHVGLRIA